MEAVFRLLVRAMRLQQDMTALPTPVAKQGVALKLSAAATVACPAAISATSAAAAKSNAAHGADSSSVGYPAVAAAAASDPQTSFGATLLGRTRTLPASSSATFGSTTFGSTTFGSTSFGSTIGAATMAAATVRSQLTLLNASAGGGVLPVVLPAVLPVAAGSVATTTPSAAAAASSSASPAQVAETPLVATLRSEKAAAFARCAAQEQELQTLRKSIASFQEQVELMNRSFSTFPFKSHRSVQPLGCSHECLFP
jgi:hypothetical protein